MPLHTIVEHDTTHIKPYIDNVKQALSNEVVTRATLGAHNLLELSLARIKEINTDGTWSGNAYTWRGITFTVNSDFSVSVSGTNDGTGNAAFYLEKYVVGATVTADNSLFAGKSVIMSGCPSGGGNSKYSMSYIRYDGSNSANDIGEGTSPFTPTALVGYTNNSHITINIRSSYAVSGTLTFYPMLRLATDSDTTYRPYVPTNSQLLSYKDNGVLGAKNFWNDNAIDMSNNNGGTHSSSNGVYTVNTTTTSSSGAYFAKGKIQSFISDYSDKPFLFTCKVKGDATFVASVGTSDSPEIVELTNTYQTLSIYFANLDAVKSITFYSRDTSAAHVITVEEIMLRLATDTDPTYQPHAMTNKQLTDEITVEDITSKLTVMSAQISTDNTTAYRIGKLVIVNILANLTADLSLTGKTLYNLDSSIKPKSAAMSIIGCIENPADSASLKEFITIRAISVSNTNIINVPNDAGNKLSFTTTTNTQIRGQIVFAIE